MRRIALAAILATALLAAPSAAAPTAKPRLGKPIRVTFPLPKKGNVTVASVQIPIRSGKRTTQALPKLGLVIKHVRGKAPGMLATYAVKRTASAVTVTKTFVLPHVLEKDGGIAPSQFSFDTTTFATYTGGLAVPGHGGATVDIYLFSAEGGRPLIEANGALCPPAQCGVVLDSSRPRKATVAVDTLTAGHPPPPRSTCALLGYGVIAAPVPDSVNLQGFIVNSQSSPFDVSVFGFEPGALAGPDAGAIGTTVHNAAVDTACRPSSARARRLERATRIRGSQPPPPPPTPPTPPPPPPPPTSFDLFVDSTHNHGTGVTNLCFPVSTTPPQPNAPGTATMTGPSGAGTRGFTTDAGGKATPVFRIDSFGQYSVSVTIRGKTVTKSHTVGSAQGNTAACPAP